MARKQANEPVGRQLNNIIESREKGKLEHKESVGQRMPTVCPQYAHSMPTERQCLKGR